VRTGFLATERPPWIRILPLERILLKNCKKMEKSKLEINAEITPVNVDYIVGRMNLL